VRVSDLSVHASPGVVVVRGLAAARGLVRVDVVAGALPVSSRIELVDAGPFRIQVPSEVGSQGVLVDVRVTADASTSAVKVVATGLAWRTRVDPATGRTVHETTTRPGASPPAVAG
jgi:hypothetical protein